jgi:hypothetical protein
LQRQLILGVEDQPLKLKLLQLCICGFMRGNVSELQLPKHWDPMAPDAPFVQIQLNPASNEYKDVETRLRSSAGNTVRQIISVSNSECVIAQWPGECTN